MTTPVRIDVKTIFQAVHHSPYIGMILYYIIKEIYARPPQFIIDNHVLQTKPDFQVAFDEWYIPASQDAFHWLMTVGFVPVSLLMTHTGRIVPRVLDPSTCDIQIYYSLNTEDICYIVTRVDPNTGVPINQQSMTDVNIGLAPGQRVHRDPREIEARRLDMATSFLDHFDPVDGNIVVFDLPDLKPSADGTLRTPVARALQIYSNYLAYEDIRRQNMIQIITHKPLVPIPEQGPDSYLQRMISEARTSGEEAVMKRAKDFFADIAVVTHNINYDIHTNTAQVMGQMGTETKEALSSRFFHQAAANIREPAYTPIVGATSVSSFAPPQITMGPTSEVENDLQKNLCRLFGIPPAILFQQASTQGSVALHESQYRWAINDYVSSIERFLNTVYSSLEQDHNMHFSFRYFFDKNIRAALLEKICRSTSRQFMMEAAAVVNPKTIQELTEELVELKRIDPTITYTLNNDLESKKPQWVPLPGSRAADTPYVNIQSVEDNTRYNDPATGKEWQKLRDSFYRAILNNPRNKQTEAGTSRSKKGENGDDTTEQIPLNFPASLALAQTHEIDDLYLYALFISEKNDLYNVAHSSFVEEDQKWLDRILKKNEIDSVQSQIEIKMVSMGAASTEDLIYYAALGFISPKEAIEQIRARCSIGQGGIVNEDQLKVFEQMKDFLASKKMAEVLSKGGLDWIAHLPSMIVAVNTGKLDGYFEMKGSKGGSSLSKASSSKKEPTKESKGRLKDKDLDEKEKNQRLAHKTKVKSTSAVGRGHAATSGSAKTGTKRPRESGTAKDGKKRQKTAAAETSAGERGRQEERAQAE